MSSFSEAEYIAVLKADNPVLAVMDDATISGFISGALRRYSRQVRKATKISADNSVVSGQSLYDFPSDALSINRLLDSESREEIEFGIEDQGSGMKFRPGVKVSYSTDALMIGDFYNNPLSFQSVPGVSGYDTFDIVYNAVLDMDSIQDHELEAIGEFVLYKAYDYNAAGQAIEVGDNIGDEVESLTDRDSTGTATTTKFTTTASSAKIYATMAAEALKRFNGLAQPRAYAVRG